MSNKANWFWMTAIVAGCGAEPEQGSDVELQVAALEARHGASGGPSSGAHGRVRSLVTRRAGEASGRDDRPAARKTGAPVDHEGRVAVVMPSDLAVGVGRTFSVQLVGKGFRVATEGGGLNVRFDPRVAQLEAVAFDTASWELRAQQGRLDNVQGKLDDLLFASFAGRQGAFPIATLTFRALVADARALRLRLAESPRNPFAGGGRRLQIEL